MSTLDELAYDEAYAVRTKHDWVEDWRLVNGYTNHTCQTCLVPFRSLPLRELCHECDGGHILRRATSVYPEPSRSP